VIDFVLFGIIKHEIDKNTTSKATYQNAIWMTLAATIVLFFAMFIVFFECCCGARRRERRDEKGMYAQHGYVGNQPMDGGAGYSRGRWWRRNRGKNEY